MTNLSHTCAVHAPDRRRILAAMAGLTISIAAAPARIAAAAPASVDDERFMRMAIDEARQADYPFGAVIVRDGEVIARGANLGRRLDDPTAHGEMQAIRHGLAQHGSAALRGATLYTSGEPCAMCMGAIIWCHFGRLVFAASLDQLAKKIDQIMIPSAEVAAKSPFAPISITGGVLADEGNQLVRQVRLVGRRARRSRASLKALQWRKFRPGRSDGVQWGYQP